MYMNIREHRGEPGRMITLKYKQKIIIAYYNKQKLQRVIAQELGLNRRTMAKYIKDYGRKRTQLMAAGGVYQ